MNDPAVTDVKKATWLYLSLHPGYYIAATVLVVAGSALSLVTHVPHFVIFALVGVILMYTFVSNKMRHYLMKQFAGSLGYQYFGSGDMSSVEGSLFSAGHSQKITDVISGLDSGRPVRIFLYAYTVGYGKNSHTYHYTIFENTFSGNMPHMLLHKEGLFLSDVPPHFSGGEHISLEGDFNKYFSLSVEKDFEVEAYQIFTPDFMEELIETSKSLGFEFSQNKLYIYTPKFIDERQELDNMFALSNKLCSHLEPVINRIGNDVDSMRGILNEHPE